MLRWSLDTDMADQEHNGKVVDTAEEAVVEAGDEHLKALTAERDALLEEKSELQNQVRYRLAEFDNYRKRSERERYELADFVTMDTLRPLLTVLDDFERAMKASNESSELAKGVELIYNRLNDTLKKMGVEPMESIGKQFDPQVHEALQREETSDAEDGTVLAEFQRGFTYKGRLLRPAMVKVAAKP